MEIASLIISIVSFTFSIYIFFSFDKKIKKQEKELNDYALRDYREKEFSKSKAILYLDSCFGAGAKGEITISNKGVSEARNIKISVISGCNEKFKGAEILSLVPNSEEHFRYYKFSQDSDELVLQVTWEDDFSQSNSKKVTLNMLKR